MSYGRRSSYPNRLRAHSPWGSVQWIFVRIQETASLNAVLQLESRFLGIQASGLNKTDCFFSENRYPAYCVGQESGLQCKLCPDISSTSVDQGSNLKLADERSGLANKSHRISATATDGFRIEQSKLIVDWPALIFVRIHRRTRSPMEDFLISVASIPQASRNMCLQLKNARLAGVCFLF